MVGNEVRKLREKLRLTQAELAQRLGVTQTCVSYWEAGIRSPRGPAAILLETLAGQSGARRKKKPVLRTRIPSV